MSKMTTEQLTEQIKSVVLPLINDTVGKEVKDVVAESIAKLNQPGAEGTKMLNGVNGAEGHSGPMIKTQEGYEMPLSALRDLMATGGFTGDGPAKRPPEHYGLGFGRCMRAFAKSKIEGDGRKGMVKILADWGDKASSEFYTKALAASDATAGGFLVPPQFSQEVIEFLRPASVIRKLGPMIIPMPTGTFRIPKMTQGITASYIGENLPAPKTQPQFGNVTLTFKKLACLVPMSNDLLRYSSPGADAIVRDDVVNGMADAENRAFLRGDGTAATPRGLLNWALPANLIAANATSNLANFTVDMGKLIVALMNQNIKMIKPGWILAPRTWNFMMTVQTTNGVFPYRDELMRGTFWGWPYGVSTAVPINLSAAGVLGGGLQSEVYLVDFADVALGEAMSMSVDASSEAAYNDGGTVVSAYSNDQTVIRAIAEHDLVMRRQESVAILTNVVYQ